MAELFALAAAFAVLAALYSTVGHGGGSGYLMAMGVAAVAAEVMKPTALTLNLFVASMALWGACSLSCSSLGWWLYRVSPLCSC